MRPEVAAHGKIEWPDFTFPRGRVHDGFDRNRDRLSFEIEERLPLDLQGHHLPVGNRFPVEGVKSQNNIVLTTIIFQPKALLHSGDKGR